MVAYVVNVMDGRGRKSMGFEFSNCIKRGRASCFEVIGINPRVWEGRDPQILGGGCGISMKYYNILKYTGI